MSVEKEYTENRRWTASTIDLFNSKELTLPAPERLLPVGKSPQRVCDELGLAASASPAESMDLIKASKHLAVWILYS